eukprot:Nk52_evm26s2568 gene=Nk52_evmTU26s2568
MEANLGCDYTSTPLEEGKHYGQCNYLTHFLGEVPYMGRGLDDTRDKSEMNAKVKREQSAKTKREQSVKTKRDLKTKLKLLKSRNQKKSDYKRFRARNNESVRKCRGKITEGIKRAQEETLNMQLANLELKDSIRKLEMEATSLKLTLKERGCIPSSIPNVNDTLNNSPRHQQVPFLSPQLLAEFPLLCCTRGSFQSIPFDSFSLSLSSFPGQHRQLPSRSLSTSSNISVPSSTQSSLSSPHLYSSDQFETFALPDKDAMLASTSVYTELPHIQLKEHYA